METPTFGEKFRALLATGRVANLPTVWSNVLVGFWLSSFFIDQYHGDDQGIYIRISLLIIIMAVCSMIYVGGCMLGDAKDVNFDREHRPGRPLPNGVLSIGGVKFTSYSLFTLAIFGLFTSTLIAVLFSYFVIGDFPLRKITRLFSDKSTLNAVQIHEMILGCLLLTSVITYAFNHKKNKRAALVMMAACRFLLVMLAIGAAQKTFFAGHVFSASPLKPLVLHSGWLMPWMFVYAAGIAIYTLLLSWVASTESKPGVFKARNILAGCLLGLPALTFIFQALLFTQRDRPRTIWATIQSDGSSIESTPSYLAFFTTMLILYLWLAYALRALKTSKAAFVSCALAGFCLLDACFIAAFAPGIAMICIVFFGLALLLQKVTPAT